MQLTPAALLLLAAVLVPAQGAHAQADGCTMTAQDLTLGRYDPLSNLPQDAVSSISVRCAVATPFVITLGPGNGTYAGRTMIGGNQALLYNLFLDPARTTVWGDGSNGSSSFSQDTTGGVFPVYARAPGGQIRLKPGTYVDIVTVTITY
ncbi:spore coat U domain-containing protein [Sphingomonas sp. PsM26]|nr:spore coat U domain-containing protein [Sphingomonas sp. PsM26]